jgi:hypothetical protein
MPSESADEPQESSRFETARPQQKDLALYEGAQGAALEGWLVELKAVRRLYRLKPMETVEFGTSRLRKAADKWWDALGEDGQAAIDSYEKLEKAMRKRFQPMPEEKVARGKLDKLTQGGRSVGEYVADFQDLLSRIPTTTEADALHAFERGLRRDIGIELNKQGVTSLSEAIAMAVRIDSYSSSSSSQPASRAASVSQLADADDEVQERINRAVLNALQQVQQGGAAAGIGAKTQTARGYQEQRSRGGMRGGRGGGGRFGQARLPAVPEVSPDVIRQRLEAGACLRCGQTGHRAAGCPNGIVREPPLN